jgi:hypothetical protein
MSKGGVVKAYDRATGRLALSDCGYWARSPKGRVASSQNFSRPAEWTREGDEIRVKADFFQINQRVPSPFLFLGFRMFSLSLGRLKSAALWLKSLLVKVLIRKRRSFPLKLRRRILLAADRVEIADEVEREKDAPIQELWSGSKFSSIHMGSSRYFQPQELDAEPADRPLDVKSWDARGVLSHRREAVFGSRAGGGGS